MAVFFFFLDGLGIGKPNKQNPLYRFGLWKHLIGLKGLTSRKKILKKNFILIPTDAVLETPGVPQSATGQTALFTGINAPRLIGGHITGLPGEELTKVLLEHSLLKHLKALGLRVTSANAYSTEYFDKVRARGRRVSASTLSIQAAGIDFRLMEDLREGQAVFMDLTHHILKTRYRDIPALTPGKAAANMAGLLNSHDFVFFEYFLTDYIGHKGNITQKKYIIRILNGFLKALVTNLNLKKHTVILSSDHGNIEDSSHKRHTSNPVPTLVFSRKQGVQQFFFRRIRNLTDIPLAIRTGFEKGILK